MKHFLFLLAATLAAASAPLAMMAQDGGPRLVVWQRSGEKVLIDLNDEPRTTFDADQIVILPALASLPQRRRLHTHRVLQRPR